MGLIRIVYQIGGKAMGTKGRKNIKKPKQKKDKKEKGKEEIGKGKVKERRSLSYVQSLLSWSRKVTARE